jgi:2-amino-4-hydroxy-6-hydroxymethyldihydropteridine diphosphokinase
VKSARSSIWETEPREFPDQPWFLNQVVEAETALMPRQLLSRLLQIEREMGRLRTVKKGPRVIDLDIRLYDGVVVNAGDLQIPHPAMSQRRFVLEPLAELASDLRIPQIQGAPGKVPTVRELLGRLQGQIVRRFDDGASQHGH